MVKGNQQEDIYGGMRVENKLLTIFNTYSKSHQVSKLLEEVGELIETIMNEDKENMVQELADVEVMLLQFKEHYHINGNDILKIMNEKIDRQLNRIDNKNK